MKMPVIYPAIIVQLWPHKPHYPAISIFNPNGELQIAITLSEHWYHD